MKRETYERALRSAAQISVLSLPLLGACGNTYVPVVDASAPDDGEDDDPRRPEECEAALAEAYPDGDPNWFGSSPTPRVDTGVSVAELVACCELLPPSAEERSGSGGPYQDSGCCSLNNETGGEIENVGLACTPWGPPMPRAMRGARQALAHAGGVLS